MAKRAEEQAAQDARFQEMMDRIAELEGQLATPTPSPVPEPEPYIPGQTPFPGIPDFIRDLDFSGLPDFLNFDYDDIMRQYNDRMEMGEPEPIDSFLFGQGSLPVENSMGMAGTLGGDGYGEYPLGSAGPRVDPSDPNYRLPPRDAGAMPPENNFFVDGDGNLNVGDGIIRTMGPQEGSTMPVDESRFTTMRENMPPPVRFKMPELPDFSNIPTPKPVLRAGDIMPNGPVVDERSYPRMPAPPAIAPINIPKIPTIPNISNIPNIPNIDFSNLPKFDLPTTGGRPMIPSFGNINLR